MIRRSRWVGRWRWVAPLALALGLAGAAWAAPAREYSTGLFVNIQRAGPPRAVCAGSLAPLDISVVKAYEITDVGPRPARLLGVRLETSVSDSTVGVLAPESQSTSPESDPPGVARFSFIAQKPGTVTVTARGRLNQKQLFGLVLGEDMVEGSLDLTVEDCEYELSAAGHWRIPEATLLSYVLVGRLARIEGQAGAYQGSAEVKWAAATEYPAPCSARHNPAPSRAALSGQVADGRLEVSVVFEQAPALLGELACPEGVNPIYAETLVQPEELRVVVAADEVTRVLQPALVGAEAVESFTVISVRRVVGQ